MSFGRKHNRSGLTRRSFGVYPGPSQSFTSNWLASPFNQANGVHLEYVHRRRAGELRGRIYVGTGEAMSDLDFRFDPYL